jgi:hypothetical protein
MRVFSELPSRNIRAGDSQQRAVVAALGGGDSIPPVAPRPLHSMASPRVEA